ncbi:phage minor head protein [Pseudomonas viridiflava]|uniref:phage head morphogenesis protein n=1 Tax=Pseudomonas viridiflava TaxID=33069 RepID=UPI000F02E9E0|nr:phage minor head protein [Pseudomonas viridiflava]
MDMIGIQYNARLQRLVKQVKADIAKEVMPLVRQLAPEYTQDAVVTTDAWSDLIIAAMRRLTSKWASFGVDAGADRIAGEFVQSALKKSERDLKKSMGIDVFSGSKTLQDYLKASAQQNAQLIKSIPAKYLDEVQTLVMANMRSGMRPGFIEKALQEQFGVSQRRAKVIARDQTGKINGELAEKQQIGAGFEYFQWIDSDDRRVRHRHSEIANKVTAYGKGIYRWDDLPLSDSGVPIKPGSDYQCRCIARPVSAREVKANQDAGRTAPGVLR